MVSPYARTTAVLLFATSTAGMKSASPARRTIWSILLSYEHSSMRVEIRTSTRFCFVTAIADPHLLQTAISNGMAGGLRFDPGAFQHDVMMILYDPVRGARSEPNGTSCIGEVA